MQVANVLARNCREPGVQGPPKSLTGSIMCNVEIPYLCPHGQANRKASCWGCGRNMREEANAVL